MTSARRGVRADVLDELPDELPERPAGTWFVPVVREAPPGVLASALSIPTPSPAPSGAVPVPVSAGAL